MIVVASIGAKALYLLFLWLVSATGAAWLSERKGYGERTGLTLGLVLSAAGLLIVLLVLPGRPGSKWLEGETPPDYPVHLNIDRAERLSRVTTLFRILLAIPQLLALTLLGVAALGAELAAWLTLLLTGRYPRPLFDFLVGTLRWGTRVSAYTLLLTDRYPPFSLRDEHAYPVRLTVDYPSHIARWRPLVNWLLVLPLVLAALALQLAVCLLAIEAWFAILVTGRYPRGLFLNVATSLRWTVRLNVFQLWVTERYPPLVWA